jgi:hypothetical protein
VSRITAKVLTLVIRKGPISRNTLGLAHLYVKEGAVQINQWDEAKMMKIPKQAA